MQFRKLTLLAVLFAAFATAACATSSAVASGAMMNTQLEVQNNLQGITGTSIYLVTETGSRRSLGPVESNQTVTFERRLRANTYYLVATRVGQEDLVSERFRIDTDNMTVTWALGQNQITMRQR